MAGKGVEELKSGKNFGGEGEGKGKIPKEKEK